MTELAGGDTPTSDETPTEAPDVPDDDRPEPEPLPDDSETTELDPEAETPAGAEPQP